MALTITFDQAKLERIRKKLGPDLIIPPVRRLIQEAARIAQAEAISRAPSVLATAIHDLVAVGLIGAKVVAAHPGARAMEAGRKPLVAGGNFPPPEAFAYITSDRGAQFAIARAVARRGTKGRFFMKKAKAKVSRMLPQLAEKTAREIADVWDK